MSTNRLCVSSPGTVAAVAGGRSEGLAAAVWMPDFDVVLLPAQVLTQHSVCLVQFNKLAVQRWVGWVTVWVQLHDVTVMRSTDQTNQWTNKYSDAGMCLSGHTKHTFSVQQMSAWHCFSLKDELCYPSIMPKPQGKYTYTSLFTLGATTWKQTGIRKPTVGTVKEEKTMLPSSGKTFIFFKCRMLVNRWRPYLFRFVKKCILYFIQAGIRFDSQEFVVVHSFSVERRQRTHNQTCIQSTQTQSLKCFWSLTSTHTSTHKAYLCAELWESRRSPLFQHQRQLWHRRSWATNCMMVNSWASTQTTCVRRG